MANTAIKVICFIAAVIVGVGIALFYDSVQPGADQNTLILIAIAMTFASFVSFYFMTKSRG